jgi:ABC-type spermidine/putrescine transport system permease subunit I
MTPGAGDPGADALSQEGRDGRWRDDPPAGGGRRLGRFAEALRARRRSTIAFLMALPLIAVIGGLVAWPAGYAIYLSTLNRRITSFIGLGNFEILLDSETFRMVIFQSVFFAVTAVILKALIGFWLAHMLHHLRPRGSASGGACCWCPG